MNPWIIKFRKYKIIFSILYLKASIIAFIILCSAFKTLFIFISLPDMNMPYYNLSKGRSLLFYIIHVCSALIKFRTINIQIIY